MRGYGQSVLRRVLSRQLPPLRRYQRLHGCNPGAHAARQKPSPTRDRARRSSLLPTLLVAAPRTVRADNAHRRGAASGWAAPGRGREFFFAPCQRSVEGAGVNRRPEAAPDRLQQARPFLDTMLASPPLDKVEYLVGAFVIAPRPPWMRQQARNSLLLESPIGHIERLSADAEGGRHVAHRPPLDQVSSEHLVLDL